MDLSPGAAEPVPAGFEPAPLDEGFLHLIGPLYARLADDETWVVGMRVAPQHTNRYGLLHGGLLSTLADVSVGMNIARGSATDKTTVTIGLNISFVSAARIGEWIEVAMQPVKDGGRVRMGECRIQVGSRLIARANATFYASSLRVR